MYLPILASFCAPCLGFAAGLLFSYSPPVAAIAAILALCCAAFACHSLLRAKAGQSSAAPAGIRDAVTETPASVPVEVLPAAGDCDGADTEFRELAEPLASALRAEVSHLPFLRAILDLTVSKSEKAVFETVDQLCRISDELRLVLERAGTVEEKINKDGSLETVAGETRSAAASETQTVRDLINSAQDIAVATERMKELVESSMNMLKDIEEVSERSQLIAFNLAIEAARIGKSGLGIKVIVNELRSLNSRIIDFSRNAAGRLKENRDLGVSIAEQMDSGIRALALKIKDGRDSSERAIEKLIASATGLDELLLTMKESFAKSRTGMDSVLVSMQFQDIIRQQIDTARWIFEEDAREAHKKINDLKFDARPDRTETETFRRKLLGRAKVQDEKNAIMGVSV